MRVRVTGLLFFWFFQNLFKLEFIIGSFPVFFEGAVLKLNDVFKKIFIAFWVDVG